MKQEKRDGRIDTVLFLIGVLASILTLIKLDNTFVAGVFGLLTFFLISAIYTAAAYVLGLPKMRLDNLFTAVIALLP